MDFEKQALQLIKFVKTAATAGCSLPLMNWSDKALALLAKIISGNEAGEKDLLELKDTEEIVHLIYFQCLGRLADENSLKKYAALEKKNLVAKCRDSLLNSGEFKMRGVICPAVVIGDIASTPSIFIDVTNTTTTRSRTGIQRVVREVSHFLCLQNDTVLIAFDRALGKYSQAIVENEDFAIAKNTDIVFRRGDIYLDIDGSWGDNLDKWHFYKNLRVNGVRILNFHYDAAPVLLPSCSHPSTVFGYLRHFFAMSTFSDRVLCISKAVEKDYKKISKIHKMRTAPSCVIPLGSKFDNPTIQPRHIPDSIEKLNGKKFILCVGTIEPRKNYGLIINALETFEKLDLFVVVVGKRGWEKEEFFVTLDRIAKKKNNFIWLDSASDDVLAYLYRSCFFYMTAAHYEGYGLPVIEALSNGCVVVTSDGGALPEVVGEHGYVFSLERSEELLEIVKNLVSDPFEYQRAKEMAAKFRQVSWENSCAGVQEIINQFLHKKAPKLDSMTMQLVYISVRPESLRKSIASFIEFGFVGRVLLLCNRARGLEFVEVFKEFSIDYQILYDEDLFRDEKIPEDHQTRNFHLRNRLYKNAAVEEYFIALDDDAVLLKNLPKNYFIADDKFVGRYFYKSMKKWKASSFGVTSYDAGQWETANALEAFGWPDKSYSAHQPQIINKLLINEIYGEFDCLDEKGVDEWSLYFNVVATRYLNMFKSSRSTVHGWPRDFASWLPEWRNSNIYFENSDSEIFDRVEGVTSYDLQYDSYYAQYLLNQIAAPNLRLSMDNDALLCGFAGNWIRVPVNEEISNVGYQVRRGADVFVDGRRDAQLVSPRAPLCILLPSDPGEYEIEVVEIPSRRLLGVLNACVFPWRILE